MTVNDCHLTVDFDFGDWPLTVHHWVTDLSHDSFKDPVQNALTASHVEDKVFQVSRSPLLKTHWI